MAASGLSMPPPLLKLQILSPVPSDYKTTWFKEREAN